MKILLDTNVVLDVLADREPHVESSAAVLSLVEKKAIRGSIAAHTATTLHCLLERELGSRKAGRALAALLRLVDVVAVDEDRLLHALAMGWDDFGDAVQAACAEKAEDDFRDSSVRILSPAALRALVSQSDPDR